MKEEIRRLKSTVATVLLFPIALVFVLLFLLITPFSYLKYRRTMYYKDTREKYSWFCTESFYIKLYEIIKKNDMPIEYYRCKDVDFTGYGYFIYKDILIINDFEPCFDPEKNIWTVEIEDEQVSLEIEVEKVINDCNDYLKNVVCNRAIVFIDNDILAEHGELEYKKFELCPILNGNIATALKRRFMI